MPQKIRTITLPVPFNMGSVNCFLVRTDGGYILIDTGGSNSRRALSQVLDSAGGEPGTLKLIVITHGDFDHIGNAAYLRDKFASKIAMHPGDSGMAERGDMFWNRKSGNWLIKRMVPLLYRFDQSNRFVPDLQLEDGYSLAGYGFDARVLTSPGHSRGSIAIVTAEGDLFCGDLLENIRQPALGSIMDDPEEAQASVEKLRAYRIHTVYPGHGRPFPMEQYSGR